MMLTIYKTSLVILIAIIPLIVGGIIYIIWRVDSLLMFAWIESFGLTDILKVLRDNYKHYHIPKWALYNLPNGTWTYTFTFIMTYVWVKELSMKRYFYISMPFLLGSVFELGQLIKIIPGVFCYGDILAHFIGASLGCLIVLILNRRSVLNVLS